MTETTIDINEIKKYIPHRYPFLLVDRVRSIVKHESIVAIKNVTVNEPFFNGHFPERPIMPGVLILEALAQASGVLTLVSDEVTYTSENLYLFAGIDEARFKRVVEPGDQLELHVEQLKVRGRLRKFKGRAIVDGELACEATFMNMKG